VTAEIRAMGLVLAALVCVIALSGCASMMVVPLAAVCLTHPAECN